MNTTYFNIGGVPEHFNIPFRKSIDEGIFSMQNIELNWKDYKGGTGDLVRALKENNLDIGILLTEGALKACIEDSQLKIIQVYVNTPLVWGIYTAPNSRYSQLPDVQSPTFCISRPGSGSHLMAYLLSQRESWNIQDITFKEVGNFSGALHAFNEKPEMLFLWERFMTKPYVDSGTLKKIGEIPTPWPSFSIVVKADMLETQRTAMIEILNTISSYTYKFKQNTLESIDYISSYFNFSVHDMKEWIRETDWNYYLDKPQYKLEGVLAFLKEMRLIPMDSSVLQTVPTDAFWENVELYPPIP